VIYLLPGKSYPLSQSGKKTRELPILEANIINLQEKEWKKNMRSVETGLDSRKEN
jgi:hypothetical protein